ncbi:MAG: hypothetical protein DRQ55_16100 [Planctomycetota bacterium]|nr:MAG: hypothetical protein DRQ55_16100 [Planctomycetota bacterium]
MNPELNCLNHYWASHYTDAMSDRLHEDHAPRPMVAIAGGQADAMASREASPDFTEWEDVGFLTGLIGYPVDAIYVTAMVPILAAEYQHGEEPPRPEGDDHRLRRAVMLWSHSVPTRETLVTVCTLHLTDTGTPRWLPIDVTDSADISLFTPLVHAAHDFEKFPIEATDTAARATARALLAIADGDGYDVSFYEPGDFLKSARRYEIGG